MAEAAKAKQKRLGRGLNSLIGEVEATASPNTGTVESASDGAFSNELPIKDIRPNPQQPRSLFDPVALEELRVSITEHGVLQPILVRPDPDKSGEYQIVAGERRWRAARDAGLERIPVIVRDLNELALLEVGSIENVQRTDLNPVEEAEAYDALMKRFGHTQESLSTKVGKSRSHIANTLRLLNLDEDVRAHLREGRLSAGHARALLTSANGAALAERTVKQGLSVREVEALVKRERDAQGQAGTSGAKKSVTDDEKDVDTRALEADLERALGLDVDIRHKTSGGEVRIKYRSLEQLDEVCRLLTSRRS